MKFFFALSIVFLLAGCGASVPAETETPVSSEATIQVLPVDLGMSYFADPNENYDAHLQMDVKPWIEWGVSAQDKTTKEERIQKLAETEEGKKALEMLGYPEGIPLE